MLPMQKKRIFIFLIAVILLSIVEGTFLRLILPPCVASNSGQDQTASLSVANKSETNQSVENQLVPNQSLANIDSLRILGDQLDHLREMNTRLVDYVRTLRPTAPGEILVEQVRHARYWVAIYLATADEDAKQRLTEALTRVGYTVTPGDALHLRPIDSEQRAKVFYFHDDAFGAADELAKLMGRLTGEAFDIRRGSGLSLPSEQQRWTFVVSATQVFPKN
ncbi:hypothetical protein CCP3SC1_140038 [Gammaproteobacteria bacterium]